VKNAKFGLDSPPQSRFEAELATNLKTRGAPIPAQTCHTSAQSSLRNGDIDLFVKDENLLNRQQK